VSPREDLESRTSYPFLRSSATTRSPRDGRPMRTSDRALWESPKPTRVVPSNAVLIVTAVTVPLSAVRFVNHGKGNRTRSACCPMSKRANGQPPIRRPMDAVTAKDLYSPGGCGIASESPCARLMHASVWPGPRPRHSATALAHCASTSASHSHRLPRGRRHERALGPAVTCTAGYVELGRSSWTTSAWSHALGAKTARSICGPE